MRLTQLQKAFLHDLLARGGSQNTQVSYEKDLQVLREYLRSDDVRVLTVAKVNGFPAWLLEQRDPRTGRPYSTPTIAHRVSTGSAFCDWLVRRGDLDRNPFHAIPRVKRPKRLPRPVPSGGVELILEKAPEGRQAIRDRAILAMLRYAGLRVTELSALNLEDLDTQEWVVRVYRKGGKEQVVPIMEQGAQLIQAYLDERGTDPGPLFIGQRGRIGRFGIRRLLIKLAGPLGVKISPHRVRHTFGTEMIRAGADLREVQAWMGHESPATTIQYTEVTANDLKKARERLGRIAEQRRYVTQAVREVSPDATGGK